VRATSNKIYVHQYAFIYFSLHVRYLRRFDFTDRSCRYTCRHDNFYTICNVKFCDYYASRTFNKQIHFKYNIFYGFWSTRASIYPTTVRNNKVVLCVLCRYNYVYIRDVRFGKIKRYTGRNVLGDKNIISILCLR